MTGKMNTLSGAALAFALTTGQVLLGTSSGKKRSRISISTGSPNLMPLKAKERQLRKQQKRLKNWTGDRA